MGDTVELTTWTSLAHHNIFYKISSEGIRFEVKANGNAVIILSKTPEPKFSFKIVIDNWLSCIDFYENGIFVTKINQRTNGVLSAEEYRSFYLTWFGGWIVLSSDNLKLKYQSNLDLKYVAFNGGVGQHTVQWRFQLPPIVEKHILKPFKGGEPRWVEAENQLPDGVVIGGYEKETLYIMRAKHRGSLTPGKFVPSQGAGFLAWGGEEHEKNEIEVLCGFNCVWVPASGDVVPVGSVVGGYSEDRHESLYIGRIIHDGHLIPGKVQLSHKTCYVGYQGKEVGSSNYEVLVVPEDNPRIANSHLSLAIEEENEEMDRDDYAD